MVVRYDNNIVVCWHIFNNKEDFIHFMNILNGVVAEWNVNCSDIYYVTEKYVIVFTSTR